MELLECDNFGACTLYRLKVSCAWQPKFIAVEPGTFRKLAYLLAPWSRVLLEKLIGFQLVKKFPAFYGTRKFITAFTSARHLSQPWASSTHSKSTSHFLNICLSIVLQSKSGSPKWSLSRRFPHQKSEYTSPLHHTTIRKHVFKTCALCTVVRDVIVTKYCQAKLPTLPSATLLTHQEMIRGRDSQKYPLALEMDT